MSLGFGPRAGRPRLEVVALPTLDALTLRNLVAAEEEDACPSTLTLPLRAALPVPVAVALEAGLRALVADFFVPDDFFGPAISMMIRSSKSEVDCVDVFVCMYVCMYVIREYVRSKYVLRWWK